MRRTDAAARAGAGPSARPRGRPRPAGRRPPRRRRFPALSLAIGLGACAAPNRGGEAAEPPPDRPNIVLVFIDDLGYGDLGVTGNGLVPTPNMDELAEEGLRFTDFYVSSPICSPSRVGLTTGMYPSRWGIHSFLASRSRNRDRGMPDWLDPRAPTLPRALQRAGYATGHFGKWHMGGGRDVGDAPLITAYGFDESVTSFEGLGPRYLWPDGLNEQSAELGRGRIEWTEKHRMTRHYVDHAIDFVRRHRDRPFYLNLWPNDVHDEHLPAPGEAEAYREVARSDYEARFFAVLEEMDRQLGRLFRELERLGLEDNTLVVLTGDNGPTDWPYYYEEGVEPPGSTGGFRGRKWSLYEGGIRQPLIVRWPGRVPAGVVDDETVLASTDLVPTLAGIAGADLPRDSLDGEDLRAALLGTPVRRREPLFWYYPYDLVPGQPGARTPPLAIRDGRWKLFVRLDGTGALLYDLEADPRETTDVADRHPDVVERLRSRLLGWVATLPLPGPGADGGAREAGAIRSGGGGVEGPPGRVLPFP